MTPIKFTQKDIAASRKVWWDLYQENLDKFRDKYRHMIKCGLKGFLTEYYDQSKCSESRRNVVEILMNIQLRYCWAKSAFDGGPAYQKADELVKRLARIANLAKKLASECEDTEALFNVGDKVIDLEKIRNLQDSHGIEHRSIDTFVGGLMTRICLDSTVLADGLSGVRKRNSRRAGRPPIVSNSYLILSGMDLYENLFQLAPIIHGSPKNPTKPSDYNGHFFEFIDRYTALIAHEDFKNSKTTTGFGSAVGKILARYREDKNLSKRLNPHSDDQDLLLSTNALASLT